MYISWWKCTFNSGNTDLHTCIRAYVYVRAPLCTVSEPPPKTQPSYTGVLSLTPAFPSHDPLKSHVGPIVSVDNKSCTYGHLTKRIPFCLFILYWWWYRAAWPRSLSLCWMYVFLSTVRRKCDRKDEPLKSLWWVEEETFLCQCSVSL